jgi:ribose-phosphate pyrophosphokinase
MIDTGSRMTSAARALKRAGATRVFAYATHGLFTGEAIERINSSDLFEIVCFNTVPMAPVRCCVVLCSQNLNFFYGDVLCGGQEKWSVRVRQLSVSGLIAECIRRLNSNDTLQPLFD